MVLPDRNRILLVEDVDDARALCAVILAEYTIILASDFDEGVRLAQQQDFDLYILDNWLPDRSGVELCCAIREFDPDTPVLFYSAAAHKRDIEEAIRAGAQDYLVKPVSLDEVRQAVARLISAAREMAS